MWRVRLSRWVNGHILGGRLDQMVCSRLYDDGHKDWVDMVDVLWFFFTLTDNHCRKCSAYDRKERERTRRAIRDSFPEEWEYCHAPLDESTAPPPEKASGKE